MPRMLHPFQCRCGALRGEVHDPARGVRAVCHCADCQAYAHVLGEPSAVLDATGGTDIVASPAGTVRITAGADQLACLSLSPRGLLRWYARCCRTPVANTPRDARLPYAGLVHTVLERPGPMERSYPPPLLRINTKSATRTPPSSSRPVLGWMRFFGLMGSLLATRIAGRHGENPFFRDGQPVAPVEVAPLDVVERARAQVRAARGAV
jgi:hypothetical protein